MTPNLGGGFGLFSVLLLGLGRWVKDMLGYFMSVLVHMTFLTIRHGIDAALFLLMP